MRLATAGSQYSNCGKIEGTARRRRILESGARKMKQHSHRYKPPARGTRRGLPQLLAAGQPRCCCSPLRQGQGADTCQPRELAGAKWNPATGASHAAHLCVTGRTPQLRPERLLLRLQPHQRLHLRCQRLFLLRGQPVECCLARTETGGAGGTLRYQDCAQHHLLAACAPAAEQAQPRPHPPPAASPACPTA